MALPPNLAALRLGKADAPHTLELVLDYLCPFSAKLLLGFDTHVKPLLKGTYASKLKVIIRPYPQSWHATSPLLHETALAVARLAATERSATDLADPDTNPFYAVSLELMKEQTKWFDAPSRNLTLDQIRQQLVDLTYATVGDGKGKAGLKAGKKDIAELTQVGAQGNTGSKVVPELKYCVKLGRQQSWHVTPSVLFDGILDPSVSSSFGKKEWEEYLSSKITA